MTLPDEPADRWTDEEVSEVLLSDGTWYRVTEESFRYGDVGMSDTLHEPWYSFIGENGYEYDGPFRAILSLAYMR